jgi:hypothetical protein
MTDPAVAVANAVALIDTPDDAAAIPAHAQILMVNQVVLPLLKRLGIPTTVQTTPQGITLALSIQGSADDAATGSTSSPDVSTLSPEQAKELWQMRERIESARSAYQGS